MCPVPTGSPSRSPGLSPSGSPAEPCHGAEKKPHLPVFHPQLWLATEQPIAGQRPRAAQAHTQPVLLCSQVLAFASRSAGSSHSNRVLRQPSGRPETRQPVPLLLEFALAGNPQTRGVHQAECLLPAPKPPADPRGRLAARPRSQKNHRRCKPAPGPFALRVPRLRCASLLLRGPLDGRLRGSPRDL